MAWNKAHGQVTLFTHVVCLFPLPSSPLDHLGLVPNHDHVRQLLVVAEVSESAWASHHQNLEMHKL